MAQYSYDENHVRYTLVNTGIRIPSATPYNWLFIPGGPGCDSSYLLDLINILEIPGNVWLIDLPGNGTNTVEDNYNFDKWSDIFLGAISRFENPILVGHSFGGMFPVLFPKLEEILKGLIILNSAPSSPREESVKCAKAHNLPDLTKVMNEFYNNPTQKTFNLALDVCAPYYFSADFLEKGKKSLEKLDMRFRPSLWWSKKMENYTAAWVPQKVPTLIVGGDCDYITPFSVYKQDPRFKRNNIVLKEIKQSGHFSWVDQPQALKNIWADFIKQGIALSGNSLVNNANCKLKSKL